MIRYRGCRIRMPLGHEWGAEQEFQEPDIIEHRPEGLRIVREDKDALVPWSNVICAYGEHQVSAVGKTVSWPNQNTPGYAEFHVDRARIEQAAKDFEPVVVDAAAKMIQNKREESQDAAEKGKQQQDEGGEHPPRNRRR